MSEDCVLLCNDYSGERCPMYVEGKPETELRSKRMITYISPTNFSRLVSLAKRKNRSISDLVNTLIEKLLEQEAGE